MSKKKQNSKLQLLLLQESWKDLFILHLSQWAIPWDLSNLLMSRQNQLRKSGNIMPNEEEIIDMEMKSMQVRVNNKDRVTTIQCIVHYVLCSYLTFIISIIVGNYESFSPDFS